MSEIQNDKIQNEHGFEHATETVLAGLRNVAPAPGMNERILQTMNNTTTRSNWSWLTASVVPATIVLAVLAAGLYLHRTRLRDVDTSAKSRSFAPLRMTMCCGSLTQEVRTAHDLGASPPVSRTQAAYAAAPQRHKVPSAVQPIERTDPETALALAELHAPSRSAPPLPLTSQERLLLNAARQGPPVELTQLEVLDLDLRTAQEVAREAALRQALFPDEHP